jgi:hypothetical protein
MDRNTNKITLPSSKVEVEFYTYITAGEKRQITEILTTGMSADSSGSIKGEIPLSLVYKSNDKAIELLIKRIGEFTSEVLSNVNNLPSNDYDFLLAEINKISNNTDFVEKKTI